MAGQQPFLEELRLVTHDLEGESMAEADVISNQKQILENQQQILANQRQIVANQEQIKGNQNKLDLVLKNQEEILALLKK